jgi:DNA polymerase-3 subunit chi
MSPVRVDFYLLSEVESSALWLLACRLIEKAYQRGHRVFVLCETEQDAEHLDELLWTYKDDSFVPHNLQGEGPEPPPPVQIGFGQEPRGFNDILINMVDPIPSYFMKFKRVIEIVAANEEAKIISRNHYRDYRNQGCQLHTHNLSQQND